jgi:hypothetical protein
MILTSSPPSVSRLSRQCGILNISQPYRPLRPITGMVLLFSVHGLVVRYPGYISRDPGFDSRRYHILRGVMWLEWGPVNLMMITEELLEGNGSGSGLENRDEEP